MKCSTFLCHYFTIVRNIQNKFGVQSKIARFNLHDIFGEESGEPERAVVADSDWFSQLTSRLSRKGILVMNFASLSELKSCAWFHDPDVQARFKAAFLLTKPQYENTVAAFLTEHATSRQLRQNLARAPGLDPDVKSTRISYRIRKI